MYYATIGILGVLILLIENQDLFSNRSGAFNRPSWRAYRRFLYAVLVYYVTDILWGLLEGAKSAMGLFVDTSFYFVAMAFGVLFWTQFVVAYLEEKKYFGRFLAHAGRIFALFVVVSSIVNFFIPVLFSVTPDCVYLPRPFRYVILIGQIALLLLVSCHMLGMVMAKRVTEPQRYQTIAVFGIIMGVFMILQLLFPYLPFYSMAYLLGSCLLRAVIIGDEKETYRHGLEMAQEKALRQRAQQERMAYQRLNALSGDFLCVYVVDPANGHYREFSSTEEFKNFDLGEIGTDFFADSREQISSVIYPDDLERFLSFFTKENVLSEVEQNGIFIVGYRLMVDGIPKHVRLKATMLEEDEGKRLIVGVNDIDMHVRQEEDFARRLAKAQKAANVDALTGVRNRHAYLDEEERLDLLIAEHRAPAFAIVMLDVNDLKTVNDTEGHKAGDQHLIEACRIICETFKRSPVFRVGGDEFTVLAEGNDYDNIEGLTEQIRAHNEKAISTGGVVIACGVAKYEGDDCVAAVFERADNRMYENKKFLKA